MAEFFLGVLEPNEASHAVVLKAMSQMISGGLSYIGIMHSHGIWLPWSCAKVQHYGGLAFARGYTYLAEHLMFQGATGYRLRPKLHYFMHLLHTLKLGIDKKEPYVLNEALHQ